MLPDICVCTSRAKHKSTGLAVIGNLAATYRRLSILWPDLFEVSLLDQWQWSMSCSVAYLHICIASSARYPSSSISHRPLSLMFLPVNISLYFILIHCLLCLSVSLGVTLSGLSLHPACLSFWHLALGHLVPKITSNYLCARFRAWHVNR